MRSHNHIPGKLPTKGSIQKFLEEQELCVEHLPDLESMGDRVVAANAARYHHFPCNDLAGHQTVQIYTEKAKNPFPHLNGNDSKIHLLFDVHLASPNMYLDIRIGEQEVDVADEAR